MKLLTFAIISIATISTAMESRQANGSLQKLILQQLLNNVRQQQPQSNGMFQGNMNGNGGTPSNQNLLNQNMGQQPMPSQNNLLQSLLDFNRPQFDQPMNSGFSNGMPMGSTGQNSNANSGNDATAKLLQLLQNKNNGNTGNGMNFNGMDFQNGMSMGGNGQRPGFMPQQSSQSSTSNSNLLSLLLGANSNGPGSSQPQNNGMSSFLSSASNDFVPSLPQQNSNSLFNGMASSAGNGMNNNILNELLGALGQNQQSQPNNNVMGNGGAGQNLMSNNLPGIDLGLLNAINGNGNGMNPQRMPMSNQNSMPVPANDAIAALANLLGNSNNGGYGSNTSNQPNPLLNLLG